MTVKLIGSLRKLNHAQYIYIFNQKGVEPKQLAKVWRLKPDIDGLRESPALEIDSALMAQGYEVIAIEPNIETHAVIELEELNNVFNEHAELAILVNIKNFQARVFEKNLHPLMRQTNSCAFLY